MVKSGKPRNEAIPDPRYRHEMLSDDRRLYVIGGGTSDSAFALAKVSFGTCRVVFSKAE